ncbi:hypothetical protein D9611_012548 [Ephemerocybe angulata]|uniref:Uncharacterized protein n=1 Tax=Ephemerocybe angulata TaxID=980116 RepID=A0A8H5ET22_9AGAR|nr:hypothetical protein D9611_012548 [Tulosesus angulatus]
MKLSSCLTLLAALLPFTLAAPTVSSARRDAASDDYNSRFLVYALSLEQLVFAFYDSSLSLLSADDFRAAGHPDYVRRGYEQILKTYQAHSDYLVNEITNLGDPDASGHCDYAFPVKSTEDFINMSEAMQALAVSAYAGALEHSHSDKYTTAFGEMLDLADMSFESPLKLNDTWTIAGGYVTSCPPGTVPDDIFPKGLNDWPILTVPDTVRPGESISISFPNTLYTAEDTLFAGFMTGMNTESYPLIGNADGSFSVTVPQSIVGKGAVWLYVIKGDGSSVRDDKMVAGPALLMMAANQEKGGAESALKNNTWSW